jgi:hypothetical protein
MQFKTKNTVLTETIVSCNKNVITEVPHIKFLGLVIDNTLSWNLHIDVMKKLTSVCYMIRSAKPYISFSLLKMVYYSLFYSILSYGIIFWGQSTNCKKLFILQKGAVRIMTGHGNRTSCRDLFKQLGILPLKSQYIFSVMLFVLKNRSHFITNYDRHNVQTRQGDNLHLPTSSLTLYQKGTYFAGIKIFNKLPSELKELVESPKIFKRYLRSYLVSHCFYKLEEYYCMNS